MGILKKLGFGPRNDTSELRVTIDTPDKLDAFITGMMGANSASGIAVNEQSALRVASVYACVRVLSTSIAKLPFNLYSRNGKVRTKLEDHPLYRLLHFAPNEWQTSFEFRQMLQGHLCLRGNAYARIVRSGGRVLELLPMHPDRVTPQQDETTFKITYKVRRKDGREVTLQGGRGGEVLHLRGLVTSGVTGLSPLQAAREAIGLSLATEKHGAKLFSNGAQIPGLLKVPAGLSDEAFDRLKASFDEHRTGVDNAHKVLIGEDGMDWVNIGMTSEDSQFLDSRKFQRSEIAAFFGVPPHKIGDLEKATFSNIEHQSLEFVIDSLMPWTVNWEQAIWRDLLTPEEQKDHFAKLNVDALLRGDSKARAEALNIKRRAGIINANEWRELDDMNPRTDTGGDDYIIEQNMTDQSTPPEKDSKP